MTAVTFGVLATTGVRGLTRGLATLLQGNSGQRRGWKTSSWAWVGKSM